MDGEDGGVVVHPGAERVEQVADRVDGGRSGGGSQGAGEVEERVVPVPVRTSGDGVGFGQAVGVQEQGVTRGETDRGGGDVGVGQDADQLSAGVGR